MRRMHLREHLFLCFALVIVLLGALTTLVGVRFIGKAVEREAQTRVEADLRIARLFLSEALVRVQGSLKQVRNRAEILAQARGGRLAEAQVSLEKARAATGLDFLALTDERGITIARPRPPYTRGDDLSIDPLVAEGLQEQQPRAAIGILTLDRLRREASTLPRKAYMQFEPTPKAKRRPETEEPSGMVLEAFLPVLDKEGNLVGGLVGGILLNRNFELVDQVKSLALGEERYGNRDIGTVTIFQWDVRISTNVQRASGDRAIGTRVSREVYDRVLENGRPWHGRAFVVNNWYITAYEPIRNSRDQVIGMLYVGILAQQYDDQKAHLIGLLAGLSVGAMILAILLSFFLARRLSRPLQRLAAGTQVISQGKLDHRVPETSRIPEVTDLTRAFNVMAAALQERDRRLRVANEELTQSNAAFERANRSYMDMLGFVSHELRNPLSSSSMSARALQQEITGPLNEEQQRLVAIVCRNLDYGLAMIGNYLDLSRIERGELRAKKQRVHLRTEVIEHVVQDLAGLVEGRKMQVENNVDEALVVSADSDLLRVVYENLVGNAIKYGREESTIILRSREEADRVVLSVYNEGAGIPAELRNKLFEKFSRAKDPNLPPSKGTGLGLFIARNIITLHGGDIWVDGEQGKWVEFTFSLPRSHDQAPPAAGD